MPKKYKVKAGIHIHLGKEYKTGETIITDVKLTKLFPEKFEDLGKVEASEVEEEVVSAQPTATSRKSRARV